jgi:hypothetical protein
MSKGNNFDTLVNSLETYNLAITSEGYVELLDPRCDESVFELCDLKMFIDHYRKTGNTDRLAGMLTDLIKIQRACEIYIKNILKIR